MVQNFAILIEIRSLKEISFSDVLWLSIWLTVVKLCDLCPKNRVSGLSTAGHICTYLVQACNCQMVDAKLAIEGKLYLFFCTRIIRHNCETGRSQESFVFFTHSRHCKPQGDRPDGHIRRNGVFQRGMQNCDFQMPRALKTTTDEDLRWHGIGFRPDLPPLGFWNICGCRMNWGFEYFNWAIVNS